MKKIFVGFAIMALVVLGIITFMVSPNRGTSMAAISPSEQVLSMPIETQVLEPQVLETSTPSVIPTATIDSAAIVQALKSQLDQTQKDLDAANRLMIEATAQHETNLITQAQITAQADNQNFQIKSWTATAALTSVPATQTQTSFNALMLPTNQSIIMTAQVMTQQAPTQIISIAQAQAQADNAGMMMVSQIVLGFGVSILCVAIAVWLFRLGMHYQTNETETASGTDVEADLPQPISIALRTSGTNYPSVQYLNIPCTPEQLTIIADGIARGETMSINVWEKKEKLGKQIILRLREFFCEHGLAFRAKPNNQVILTSDGENLLAGWRAAQLLPHSFQFDPDAKRFMEENIHAHEVHDHEIKPGEGLTPIPSSS